MAIVYAIIAVCLFALHAYTLWTYSVDAGRVAKEIKAWRIPGKL